MLSLALYGGGSGDEDADDDSTDSSLPAIKGTISSGDVGEGGTLEGASSLCFFDIEFVLPADDDALFFSSEIHSSR